MRLSRAECVARLKEFAKAGGGKADAIAETVVHWAIFAEDALMDVQRNMAKCPVYVKLDAEVTRFNAALMSAQKEAVTSWNTLNEMNHELALRVAALETIVRAWQEDQRQAEQALQILLPFFQKATTP